MDRELVERAQTGDHDAFAALARPSFRRAYDVARLILRDDDRAQDAVQEAYVQAWKHIRALRDPAAWDAWMHRLVVPACFRAAPQGAGGMPGLRAAPGCRPARRPASWIWGGPSWGPGRGRAVARKFAVAIGARAQMVRALGGR